MQVEKKIKIGMDVLVQVWSRGRSVTLEGNAKFLLQAARPSSLVLGDVSCVSLHYFLGRLLASLVPHCSIWALEHDKADNVSEAG